MIQKCCFSELLMLHSMYDSQVVSIFSLCDTLELSTDTCEEVLYYGRQGKQALTGLHQDPEIVWIPRKAWPHWCTWSTVLNPGSGRAENQKHGLWEPTWCVITEQMFQTWQTWLQLALAIEEGHNTACHIVNCNHYVPGEKKAEISHSFQSSLGHWAVKSARARARKGAGMRMSVWCTILMQG